MTDEREKVSILVVDDRPGDLAAISEILQPLGETIINGVFMKCVVFSQHAMEHLADRGATEEEAVETLRHGESTQAKRGRLSYRKNFPYGTTWKGKHYETKQVMPIVVEEDDRFVVVTVYVYYFGGKS